MQQKKKESPYGGLSLFLDSLDFASQVGSP
jgi:hypothetical protein